ncbi:MAG: hypothetical protein AABW84_00350 [Nanoarchaeota archaeon]
MANGANKFEYVQFEDYDGLIGEIKLILKDLKECSSDVEDLQKLCNEKQKEANVAKKIILDIKTHIQELNSMFMKDLFGAEKASNKTSDASPKEKKITKLVNKDALMNLQKNLDELRNQLDRV